jgi:hypothetical protein
MQNVHDDKRVELSDDTMADGGTGRMAHFPGAKATYTEKLTFLRPDLYDGIPVYRVMDREGNVIDPDHDPNLTQEELIKMYKSMTM